MTGSSPLGRGGLETITWWPGGRTLISVTRVLKDICYNRRLRMSQHEYNICNGEDLRIPREKTTIINRQKKRNKPPVIQTKNHDNHRTPRYMTAPSSLEG